MKVFVPGRFGVGVRLSTGHYLPPICLDNAAVIARGCPMTDAEIRKLSGIETRHHARPGQATSDLAIAASREALAASGLAPAAIDRVVLATTSPDQPVPAAACRVQHALGLRPVPAFDLSAACAGFVYALDHAARAVVTGEDAVLAVASEVRSRVVDPTDRSTAALFGDGAAAAVVERGPVGTGLLAIGLMADGAGADHVQIPAGGSRLPASLATVANRQHFLQMRDGPQVYFAAVQGMLDTAQALLDAMSLGFADLDWIVPHQPNARLLKRMARLARVPLEKVVMTVQRTGNTSSAACGIAYDQAARDGRIQPGQRVLLLTAGAGYTAGAALIQA